MKPPFIDSVRDATTESLTEYRLILWIMAACSIMAIVLMGPNVAAYVTALQAMLP